MWFKAILAILLGSVATSAVVFYFWDQEITDILTDEIDKRRKLLEECLHASTRKNNDQD